MEASSGWQVRSPPGSAGASWDDRRSRNMQRNQQYLAQLFADAPLDEVAALVGGANAGKGSAAAPGDGKSVEGALRALHSNLRDLWGPRVASHEDALSEACANCPCRESLARRLIGYISESSHPLPPLLISGPSGCGKSLLATRALTATDTFHVYVLCSAFASHGQLIRGTWMAFVKSLIRRVACSQTRSPNVVSAALLQLRPLEGKPVFSVLANALRETIEKFGITDVIFCFDRFDAVDRLEHTSIDGNTYVKLLNMAELVHESIRVIAIQRRSDRTSASAVVSSGSFVMPPPLSLKFPPYSDGELLRVVEAHAALELGEKSSEFGIFLECLKESISQIRMTSNHPEEIFNAVRLIMKVKLKNHSPPAAVIDCSRSGDSYSTSMSEGKGCGAPPVLSTRSIADQVMRIPYQRLFGEALESVLQTAGSGRTASFGDSINSALYGANWISNVPIRTRYFLLAAYLASKNPKESDKFTFGDSRKGRRKRVREGMDDDGAATDGGGPGPGTHMTHSPQPFTLDRVLAIYRHIYGSHEDSNLRPYGGGKGSTPQRELDLDGGDGFFAMISTLEKCHWIAATSGWRGDQPAYYFRCDSEAVVNVVAKSVHFPLQNYLTGAVAVGINA